MTKHGRPARKKKPLPRCRVLIAEDDPSLRLAMAELLGAEPAFELVGAVADAEAAIEAARTKLPDVAIVDVRMPGGGGAAATRGIRAASARTRVVAFTGHDDRSVATELFAAGVTGFVVKGSAIEEVIAAIHEAADRNHDGA